MGYLNTYHVYAGEHWAKMAGFIMVLLAVPPVRNFESLHICSDFSSMPLEQESQYLSLSPGRNTIYLDSHVPEVHWRPLLFFLGSQSRLKGSKFLLWFRSDETCRGSFTLFRQQGSPLKTFHLFALSPSRKTGFYKFWNMNYNFSKI